MRLLLDNNLSPRVGARLRTAGWDVVHVRDRGLHAAVDEAVLQLAADESRILVSADTDFGQILSQTRAARPSVVLVRRVAGRRVEALADLLLLQLPVVEPDLDAGCVVAIGEDSLRVRRLPLG